MKLWPLQYKWKYILQKNEEAAMKLSSPVETELEWGLHSAMLTQDTVGGKRKLNLKICFVFFSQILFLHVSKSIFSFKFNAFKTEIWFCHT